MYLRKVTYQLGLRVKSLVPCFHQSHLENLVLLVIGIAYSRSVSLPKAAGAVPYNRIQVESRVQRFERLVQCEKLVPLEAEMAFHAWLKSKPPRLASIKASASATKWTKASILVITLITAAEPIGPMWNILLPMASSALR